MIFRAALGSGWSPAFAACHSGLRRLDRRAVDACAPPRCRSPLVLGLLEVDAADRDAPDAVLLEPGRRAAAGARRSRQLEDERADLVARDAARDRDLLDVALAQVAREPDQRRRPTASSRCALTTTSSPMKPMTMASVLLERRLRQRRQRVDAAPDERVVRRVERRAADRGGEPAHQLLVDPGCQPWPCEPCRCPRELPQQPVAVAGRVGDRAAPPAASRFAAARRSTAASARALFRRANQLLRRMTCATCGTASSPPTSPSAPSVSSTIVVIAAERIALVEDADEHRDDARVALGDERGDDRLALLARGGAQHGVHRARPRPGR